MIGSMIKTVFAGSLIFGVFFFSLYQADLLDTFLDSKNDYSISFELSDSFKNLFGTLSAEEEYEIYKCKQWPELSECNDKKS